MLRLFVRKLFVLVVLVLPLHAAGFFYAATHPLANQATSESVSSYGDYLAQVLAGDLGQIGPQAVATIVGTGLRNSLVLLSLALALTMLVGPVIGYLSLSRRTRQLTPTALLVITAGVSLPAFFLGVTVVAAMIYATVSAERGGTLLPVSGYGLDQHLILPVATLAAGPMLRIARVTADVLASELHQDYVRLARSKGLGWRRIYARHVVPNALPSVIVAAGRALRFLVSGLIVVEALFFWPGLGRLFASTVGIPGSVQEPVPYLLHPPLLATLAVVIGVTLILADLVTSMLAHWSDPRLSLSALEDDR